MHHRRHQIVGARIRKVFCLYALQLKHFHSVAAAKHTIAFGSEVQLVEVFGAGARTDCVSVFNHFGQTVDKRVVSRAGAATVRVDNLASQQRNIVGVQVQVFHKVVVNRFNHTQPLFLTSVGLALVQQNAFNHATLFLCDFSHINKTLIGVVVVCGEHSNHPLGTFFAISGNAVFHKCLDIATANGNVYHADTYVFGQVLNHCATKVVDRCKASVFAAERRNSRVHFAHFAAHFRKIDGGHHLEARIDILTVNLLNLGVALHIRLSEAEINLQLFVVLCISR